MPTTKLEPRARRAKSGARGRRSTWAGETERREPRKGGRRPEEARSTARVAAAAESNCTDPWPRLSQPRWAAAISQAKAASLATAESKKARSSAAMAEGGMLDTRTVAVAPGAGAAAAVDIAAGNGNGSVGGP